MRASHWGQLIVGAILMPLIAFLLDHWWPWAAQFYPSYNQCFWYMAGAFGFWITGKRMAA